MRRFPLIKAATDVTRFDVKLSLGTSVFVLGLLLACGGTLRHTKTPLNLDREGIVTELVQALPEDRWASGCPNEYQPWAEAKLRGRIELAATNLADGTHSREELNRAIARLPKLIKKIAKTARTSCTPAMCQGRHVSPPAIELELNARLCPGFFPFC